MGWELKDLSRGQEGGTGESDLGLGDGPCVEGGNEGD